MEVCASVHWWGVGTVGGGGLMISHVHSNIVLAKVECKAILVAEIVFPIMIVLMLTIQCCSLRGIRQSLEEVSKSVPVSTCIVQLATCSLCLARRMEGGLGRSSQKDTMHFALWSASGSLSERWAKHCEMTFPPVNVMLETGL